MATTTPLTTRIDRKLHAVQAEADFLPDLEEEWPTLAESAQVSQALYWDHLMASYMIELDRAYRGGDMSENQRARYRALLGRLRELLPVIDRLHFDYPHVSLDH